MKANNGDNGNDPAGANDVQADQCVDLQNLAMMMMLWVMLRMVMVVIMVLLFYICTIVFHFLGIRLRLSGLKHWLEEIGVER